MIRYDNDHRRLAMKDLVKEMILKARKRIAGWIHAVAERVSPAGYSPPAGAEAGTGHLPPVSELLEVAKPGTELFRLDVRPAGVELGSGQMPVGVDPEDADGFPFQGPAFSFPITGRQRARLDAARMVVSTDIAMPPAKEGLQW